MTVATLNGVDLEVGPLNTDKTMRLLDALALLVASSTAAQVVLNDWLMSQRGENGAEYEVSLGEQLAIFVPRIWRDSRGELLELLAIATLDSAEMETAEYESDEALQAMIDERSRLIRYRSTPAQALALVQSLLERARAELSSDDLGESLSGLGSIFETMIDQAAGRGLVQGRATASPAPMGWSRQEVLALPFREANECLKLIEQDDPDYVPEHARVDPADAHSAALMERASRWVAHEGW